MPIDSFDSLDANANVIHMPEPYCLTIVLKLNLNPTVGGTVRVPHQAPSPAEAHRRIQALSGSFGPSAHHDACRALEV